MTYQGTGDFTGVSGKKYHGPVVEEGDEVEGVQGLVTTKYLEAGTLAWGMTPLTGKIYSEFHKGRGGAGEILSIIADKLDHVFAMDKGQKVVGPDDSTRSGYVQPGSKILDFLQKYLWYIVIFAVIILALIAIFKS